MSNKCQELSHYIQLLRFVDHKKGTYLSVIKRYHTQKGAWSLYISFQNHDTQEGIGKFIYKPSILDENNFSND